MRRPPRASCLCFDRPARRRRRRFVGRTASRGTARRTTSATRAREGRRSAVDWRPRGPLPVPGGPGRGRTPTFGLADPQTDVVPGLARDRNVRSRGRCSMCPAIHINSRSWLRSSSTHEPSDPPLRVVTLRRRSSCRSIGPGPIRGRRGGRPAGPRGDRRAAGPAAPTELDGSPRERDPAGLRALVGWTTPPPVPSRDPVGEAPLRPPGRAPGTSERLLPHGASFGNDPSAGSPTETLLRLLLPLNDQV